MGVEQSEASRQASTKVAVAIGSGRPNQILELLKSEGLEWRSAAVLGCKAAEGLTKLKAYPEALQALDVLQREFPRAIRPKQLRAVALNRRARDGGPEQDLVEAQAILGELSKLGERDPETLGIYGATWTGVTGDRAGFSDLTQSRDLYTEAFDGARDDYYTGINAASKSVLIGGDAGLARGSGIAARVQQIVGTKPTKGDYWRTATAAEAFLIQRNYADPARLYEAAVATARAETGSHESTWRQTCALMAKLQPSAEERALVRRAFEHLPDCEHL